jgi:hypothetical protein
MSLLSVLQSEHAALVLGFLNNEYMELLEVARPIRNSPAFAWAVSTYTSFTLNKVDVHLRTDALCRRAMVHYMTFKFPYKFTRVWSGVPNDIFRPDFVQFFQSLFHSCRDRIGDSNKTEIDELAEYEHSLLTNARAANEIDYSDEEDALEAEAAWRSGSWARGLPKLWEDLYHRHGVVENKMRRAYAHVVDESCFGRAAVHCREMWPV